VDDGVELGEREADALPVGLTGAAESVEAVELAFVHAAPKTASARRMVMERVGVVTCEG
jgi:hypothetical protein